MTVLNRGTSFILSEDPGYIETVPESSLIGNVSHRTVSSNQQMCHMLDTFHYNILIDRYAHGFPEPHFNTSP